MSAINKLKIIKVDCKRIESLPKFYSSSKKIAFHKSFLVVSSAFLPKTSKNLVFSVSQDNAAQVFVSKGTGHLVAQIALERASQCNFQVDQASTFNQPGHNKRPVRQWSTAICKSPSLALVDQEPVQASAKTLSLPFQELSFWTGPKWRLKIWSTWININNPYNCD